MEQYLEEDTDDVSYEAYEDEEVKARLTPEQYQFYLEYVRDAEDEDLKEICTPEEYAEYMEAMKEVAENVARDPNYYNDLYEDTSSSSDITTELEAPVYAGDGFDPNNIDTSDLIPCEVN